MSDNYESGIVQQNASSVFYNNRLWTFYPTQNDGIHYRT